MIQLNQVLLQVNNRFGADFQQWLEVGGGEGLRKALIDPAAVVETIKEAGLRGLGGSGFPTHVKWGFIINQKKKDVGILLLKRFYILMRIKSV